MTKSIQNVRGHDLPHTGAQATTSGGGTVLDLTHVPAPLRHAVQQVMENISRTLATGSKLLSLQGIDSSVVDHLPLENLKLDGLNQLELPGQCKASTVRDFVRQAGELGILFAPEVQCEPGQSLDLSEGKNLHNVTLTTGTPVEFSGARRPPTIRWLEPELPSLIRSRFRVPNQTTHRRNTMQDTSPAQQQKGHVIINMPEETSDPQIVAPGTARAIASTNKADTGSVEIQLFAPPHAIPMPDAAPKVIANATSIEEFEHHLLADRERHIDLSRIAVVLNNVRSGGFDRQLDAQALPIHSMSDAISGISASDRQVWFDALGVSKEEQARMDSRSFWSGFLNPTGSILGNVLNYVVSPAITVTTGNPWAGAGFGMAVSFILSPVLTAGQQTAVVNMGEHMRDGGFSVNLDKKAIHDKNWLPECIKHLHEEVGTLVDMHTDLCGRLNQMAKDHEVPATGMSQEGNVSPLTAQEFNQLGQLLSEKEWTEIRASFTALKDAGARLQQAKTDLFTAQGARGRQQVGNAFQGIPRSLKGPASTLVGLGRGAELGDATYMKEGVRQARYSKETSLGIQTSLAVFLHLGQMVASGVDEKRKQYYSNDLNMIGADVFTVDGKKRWNAGHEIRVEDLDPAKLRSLVRSPASNVAARMTELLKSTAKGAEETIKKIQENAARRVNNPDGPASPGTIEAGRFGSPLTLGESREVTVLQTLVSSCKRDIATLDSGHVSKLDAAGIGRALLENKIGGWVDKLFLRDTRNKYNWSEFSSQFIQRMGQGWNGIVCGSSVASVLGKVSSAAVGGSSKATSLQIGAVAGAGLVLAAAGAWTQYLMINAKNNRRAHPEKIGMLTQFGRSVNAIPSAIRSAIGGPSATNAANSQQARTNAFIHEIQDFMNQMEGSAGSRL